MVVIPMNKYRVRKVARLKPVTLKGVHYTHDFQVQDAEGKNVMPGDASFLTQADALKAIGIWQKAGGDATMFWSLWDAAETTAA